MNQFAPNSEEVQTAVVGTPIRHHGHRCPNRGRIGISYLRGVEAYNAAHLKRQPTGRLARLQRKTRVNACILPPINWVASLVEIQLEQEVPVLASEPSIHNRFVATME